MKKSEITSPGHLIAYYTAKIKEADDIANNCEDIYRLIIHYAKLQEARRQVNKEKELLAQGYEDIRQDIARKDAQLPLKAHYQRSQIHRHPNVKNKKRL